MKPTFIAAAFAASLFATTAAATPFPAVTVSDLNGQDHVITSEWRGHGGVVILGFAHDAREGMDRWVEALGLNETDTNWIELPVIGDVNAMVRPMIRSGMRTRYASTTRRAHIAPVFDNADVLRTNDGTAIAVLVISADGDILARVEGEATPANIAAIRTARTP